MSASHCYDCVITKQRGSWRLKSQFMLYLLSSRDLKTIAFFCGVWEFDLLNAATTNKNQCCPSWCLPVPHTWLSHSWTARRHLFQRLEPPQLTHSDAKEQQLQFPRGRPNCSPLHWHEPRPHFACFLPLSVIRWRLWARSFRMCSECWKWSPQLKCSKYFTKMLQSIDYKASITLSLDKNRKNWTAAVRVVVTVHSGETGSQIFRVRRCYGKIF